MTTASVDGRDPEAVGAMDGMTMKLHYCIPDSDPFPSELKALPMSRATLPYFPRPVNQMGYLVSGGGTLDICVVEVTQFGEEDAPVRAESTEEHLVESLSYTGFFPARCDFSFMDECFMQLLYSATAFLRAWNSEEYPDATVRFRFTSAGGRFVKILDVSTRALREMHCWGRDVADVNEGEKDGFYCESEPRGSGQNRE